MCPPMRTASTKAAPHQGMLCSSVRSSNFAAAVSGQDRSRTHEATRKVLPRQAVMFCIRPLVGAPVSAEKRSIAR
jgi:hypothetical protein